MKNMEKQSIYTKRRKLLRYVRKGYFDIIMAGDYVVKALVLPLCEKDSVLKLLGSDFKGDYCVLWKDKMGGEAVLRMLESSLSVAKLLTCPDLKVRIHITDCCGNSKGFIEPELLFGFIPEWEERL